MFRKAIYIIHFYLKINKCAFIHCLPKIKEQPALFSSFVYNFSSNELKSMKLSEHICYEMINWILYYCGFGNSL